MKINIGIISTSAVKKPSDKSVKKAAAVLKQANKAKADALKEKLQEAIDKVVSIDKEATESKAVLQAQIDKLTGQVGRLTDKRDAVDTKLKTKIVKPLERVTDLQVRYEMLGGKDLVPNSLVKYYDLLLPDKSHLEGKKSKKSALGKGVKDLKSSGKKTGKAIEALTGKSKTKTVPKKRPKA